jgi:hypothetical protein
LAHSPAITARKGTANHIPPASTARPPHDSKEYGKAVAQAAPPHSQTSLRRRTSVAERSACGDRSVMLPKASAIYLATCQDGSSNAPCGVRQRSLLRAALETFGLCRPVLISSLEHRLFCLTLLTCILNNRLVGEQPHPLDDDGQPIAYQKLDDSLFRWLLVATSWGETLLHGHTETPRKALRHCRNPGGEGW